MMKTLKVPFIGLVLLGMICWSCGESTGTFSSDNWEATIKKVYYEKDYQSGAKQYSGLMIRLSVKYLGPAGKVNAPILRLIDEKGNLIRATLLDLGKKKFNSTGILLRAWLGDKELTFDLKPGDTLSEDGFGLLWQMKDEEGDFKLMVGDISPIPVSW
jgi:hypothetical protein